MSIADIIVGRVGATILRQRIATAKQADGASDAPALFRLDRLSSGHIAAIVREIHSDAALQALVDVRIPRTLVVGETLPPELLTDENAGAVRNTPTDKAAMLTANGLEPNLEDTLGHVTPIGAAEFHGQAAEWVEATILGTGLLLADDDHQVFISALKGLLAAEEFSLHQLAAFCAAIGQASKSEGLPIRAAIGRALPELRLPRDTALFTNSRTYGIATAPWRKAFEKLFNERAPLVVKQRKNGQTIDGADIHERLVENEANIKPEARPIITGFIAAQPGDLDVARALCEFEWEADGIHLLFDRPKEKKRGLADETIDFFKEDCNDTDVLSPEWEAHLVDLRTREKRNEWTDEDEQFFDLHRAYLDQHPKLKARWEKALFGKPIDCTDFLEGLVTAIQRLTAAEASAVGDRRIRIKVARGRKDWRERFNHDIGNYFSTMYRALRVLLQERVSFERSVPNYPGLPDPLFDFPAFLEFERARKPESAKPVISVARQQIQLKFEVGLEIRQGDKLVSADKTHLIWWGQPEAIGLQLLDDLQRLRQKGTIACTEVPRRLVSKKGGIQSVSLLDVSTLEATFGRDAGSLVPQPAKIRNLGREVAQAIKQLKEHERLTAEQAKAIAEAWERFQETYQQALGDMIGRGLHTDAVMEQAEHFAALLRLLKENARGDVARSKLVNLVLRAGTVVVTGDQPSLVVPPWHPERMKALAVKLRRTAGLINHLLSSEHIDFGDRNIFFQEFTEELAHPFYPEVAVADRNGAPVLVAESSTVNGYSLMEQPVQSGDDELTDVSPTEAARQVRELIERYVGLQRHEASSMSVVLYNADAAALPLATVRALTDLESEESDLQCNVAVRHTDPGKLRKLYAELVSKSDADPDVPVVSETSDNFMSKLRISVVPTSGSLPESAHGFRPFDIAFLHDVVARTASPEWVPQHWLNDRDSLEHAPSRWSYRSVSGENELKSTTFLTCPQQTASGRAYLDMVGAVVRQQDPPAGHHLVPARQISLKNERLGDIFRDAHQIAEWVATYDELLDKRQLLANDIKVVRYRRHRTNGRNMIVSSTSELRLLKVLARRRIDELGLNVPADRLDTAADRVIRDALAVSGDIVLRAAKRGVSAGEMLGLILSRYLIQHEFWRVCGSPQKNPVQVFFLLDDYASWLAQRESRIADLLGLCIEESAEGIRLHLAIVESKYVAAEAAADAKRGSRAQLLATLTTLREALFGDPGRLDRDLWLARLADLLIDAVIPPDQTALLERARDEIRKGTVQLSLRGYSHVFLHSADAGQPDTQSVRAPVEISAPAIAFQEVFDRTALRRIAEAYALERDPTEVRESIGGDKPWEQSNAHAPAARVTWTDMVGKLVVDAAPPPTAAAPTVPSTPNVATSAPTPLEPAAVPEPEVPVEAAVTPVSAAPANAAASASHPAAAYGPALTQLIAGQSGSAATATDDRETWAREMTGALKKALNSYGLQANVIGTRLTPNGCLVRLAGSDRLRVEDIESKRMQLLTTHSLQLVTVQPKPGEIIVSIAGEKRQAVSLWDVWARRELKRNAAGINTSFVLGLQELNGNVLYLNLGGDFGGLSQHEPHSLVAGATGSGKSVLIQSLLLDIAATNRSQLAKIVLIDPKMGVDYAALAALPHLREPIITTQERAIEVLKALVEEMDQRYWLFAAVRARDLPTFNSKVEADRRLPMIVLVHDEFADWMLDDNYKGVVSAAVARLGVKARAAGIHLVFAAQRPDKDVMPMQLRENLGNRLILKVASEATSKIALDRPGAELLLGKGHLAAKLAGEQGLLFGQAPFLNDDDIAVAVEAIRADSNNN